MLKDNTVLLCSNDIVSRFQNGLLSLYKSPEDLLKQNVLTSLKEEVTSSAAAFINSNLVCLYPSVILQLF